MIRGTRFLEGNEAEQYRFVLEALRITAKGMGYSEVVVPSLWETQTFIDKAGPEIVGQLYSFKDQGDRAICLVPEITALIQERYREHWAKSSPKPVRVFYEARCFRYERPQAGRYREFTQFGIEMLGASPTVDDTYEVQNLLKIALACAGLRAEHYVMNTQVKRGLHYYTEDGFEVSVDKLGAQKQIAGGGRYAEGIGWAIGVDRLMLALNNC
jgi:histidyl-tRNA synthetase